MINHFLLSILGVLFISIGFGQDYSFTIIDNSDFENCVKYRVKACHMYSFPDVKNAPNDSIPVSSYFYNELGQAILEIDYIEPQDTTKKWILTAQYDGLIILSEQWQWESNDIDSTTFYYDDQGVLNQACIKYYLGGEFDEMECEEYVYQNGEFVSLSFPNIVDLEVKKNDTIYHYYQNGNLWYKETKGKKVMACSYGKDEKLTSKYYFTYNANGDIDKTTRTDADGKIIAEFKNTYKGTLLIEKSEYDVTTGVYSKARFNYIYFE